MKRLIEKGLMFGNMVHVTSPVWITRYNRALKRLTGQETKLDDFHIDISGFSPEIADELGDDLYLNPKGVNRQFILLTPDQKHAPLLDAKFSFSRVLIRGFIDQNEAQLFALTTQDAVAGELVNSVFEAKHPNALLDIRQIEIEADTTDDTLARAGELAGQIDTFLSSKTAWQDDVMIAKMIGLAKHTGDVVRNPVRLTGLTHKVDSFWTAHFGGAFFFRIDGELIVVAHDPKQLKDLSGAIVLGLDQSEALAKFLFAAGLVEPLLTKKGAAGAEIVQRKMDMLAAYAIGHHSNDTIPQGGRQLRRLARAHSSALPAAWRGLSDLQRWATGRGDWPRINSGHPSYFYSLRAARGPERDLVNRLIAALTPMDMRQLFICYKEAFYPAYAKWPDPLKDFAANMLAADYQSDKAAVRDALFGEFPDDDPADVVEAQIAAVGPWGAVRR